MTLTALFKQLDAAVATVADAKLALDEKAASVRQTIAAAQAELAQATRTYDDAITAAQGIRADLRDQLDTVLPPDDGRVRQS